MARPRLPDALCEYSIFNRRKNGKVPCLAVGNSDFDTYLDNYGEITGICFQKIDEGEVKPCIQSRDFTPVDWPNAPTRGHAQPVVINFEQPIFAPTVKLYEFANLVLHLRTVLLNQMTDPNRPPPATLYDAFKSNFWNGGYQNKRESSAIDSTVLQMLGQNAGSGWDSIVMFRKALIRGLTDCTTDVSHILRDLVYITFDSVYKRRYIVQAPETSSNTPVTSGVVHCLVYGFHPIQIEGNQQQYQDREGRLRHRVVRPKSLGNRSRSRSRSPSPANIDVENDIINVRTGLRPIDMHEVLQSPDQYEIDSRFLHHYIEPHKPDSLIYLEKTHQAATVTVLLEISSYRKFGKNISFQKHLQLSTEQVVQQCLAGISEDQPKISGLLFVPDGMKFIEVEIQHDENHTYLVRESHLVTWDQTDQIYALFYHLENLIQFPNEWEEEDQKEQEDEI